MTSAIVLALELVGDRKFGFEFAPDHTQRHNA